MEVPLNWKVVTILIWLTTVFNTLDCTDLYSENDDIVLLGTATFNKTVLGKPYPWLVEFYNSWCGHCVRYAPVYKQLANEVKDWQPFVTVAAVNCAADENAPLCREHSITQYPTVMWFPAHSSSSTSIILDEFDTVFNTRHSIINLLESNFDVLNSTDNSIRVHNMLTPLSKGNDVFKFGTNKTQRYAIVLESPKSFVGREVILDLWSHERLVVRRVLDNVLNKAVLHLVSNVKNKFKMRPVIIPQKRNDFTAYLLRLLHSDNVTMFQKSTPHVVGQSDWIKPIENRDTTVHQQDLESGLQYSLRHEIAMNGLIEGEQLSVLKGYIGALAKFLPLQTKIASLLNKLHQWLLQQHTLTGSAWLSQIDALQTVDAYLPSITRWTGCQGSQVRFRGYPCSLWTTFHTLLVSAATAEDPSMNARQVLLYIRGYVQHFFGCRECSQNFMRGAVHIEDRVHSNDDAILFLWRSHNKANWNLHGDATEDPHHPKIQFPSKSQCSPCNVITFDNGTTSCNELEVLRFLRGMYSKESIISDSNSLNVENLDSRSDDNKHRGFTAILQSLVRHHAKLNGTIAISTLDVSLCFAFYCLCACFLILLYCRFSRHCRLKAVVRHLQSSSV